MDQQEKDELVEAASNLYENVKADIENAGTRIEHIRLTTLANEAEKLYVKVVNYVNGGQDLSTED
jgi:hypothetical protein